MRNILIISIVINLFFSISFGADESFNVSIIISAPIAIAEDQGLNFGSFETSNSAQNIVVEPGDLGSAQFDIAGNEVAATWSIAENSIDMISGTDTIRVNSFKVSGGGSGNLPQENVRVGATARIKSKQPPGTYIGTATFNVVYN